MPRDSRWADEIIAKQSEDGTWGYFHSLGEPKKYPLTTEQALRRLEILGYTIQDEPIQKSVHYMNDCLLGRKEIPDRHEKIHDWDIFTDLMLSTWIRRFTKDCEAANKVADLWRQVISFAFQSGTYRHTDYVNACQNIFLKKTHGGRLVDFVTFYQVSLMAGCLDEKVESAVFDYVLQHKSGIYYIYDRPLYQVHSSFLPDSFTSKKASRYIAAIELLTLYPRNVQKLNFVVNWLNENQNENGKWDMGSGVNDKVYFPLSDNWRTKKTREYDCTCRIQKLIDSISLAK